MDVKEALALPAENSFVGAIMRSVLQKMKTRPSQREGLNELPELNAIDKSILKGRVRLVRFLPNPGAELAAHDRTAWEQNGQTD